MFPERQADLDFIRSRLFMQRGMAEAVFEGDRAGEPDAQEGEVRFPRRPEGTETGLRFALIRIHPGCISRNIRKTQKAAGIVPDRRLHCGLI